MTVISEIKLPELVVCGAIEYEIKKSGELLIVPCTTYNSLLFLHLKSQVELHIGKLKEKRKGFLTNRDRFITQDEAVRIVVRQGQLRRYNLVKDPNLIFPEELY